MPDKPTPPRRGLPVDDPPLGGAENIGALVETDGRGGRFLAVDPAPAPGGARRGRRMLDPDESPLETTNHAHSPYMRPEAIAVPPPAPLPPSPVPPPTPVPPFRGGRATGSATGSQLSDVVTASSSASAGISDTATQVNKSASVTVSSHASETTKTDGTKSVWEPGPAASKPSDDGDVLHHAPRRLGGRVRLIALIAGILVVGLIAVFGIKKLTDRPVQGPSVSVTDVRVTPTVPPPFATDDLATVEDAAKVVPGTWTIHETIETVTESSPVIACVGTSLIGAPDPTLSRIRTLSTTPGGPAMVMRLDAYTSKDAAHQAFGARSSHLSGCEGTPAYLDSSSSVTGLADEVTQVTVAYQDAKTLYHTVLVARVGNSIVMTDVLNPDTAVGAQQAVDGTVGTIARFCKDADAACPNSPRAVLGVLPPAGLAGWLVPNDIPRITPGAGQWSANDPVPPHTQGSLCDDVGWTRPAGATSQQRTYLLSQDELMPPAFGLDELSLSFTDEAKATAFATKVAKNINGCPKRNSGVASILQSKDGTAKDAAGKAITAKTWKYALTLDAKTKTYWQVAVVTSGTHLIFLINNTSASYGLDQDEFVQLALRAGLRATQSQ